MSEGNQDVGRQNAGRQNGGACGLAPRAFTAQDVADREALRHLVDAYGHCIDRRDYELLRTLYHPDAVDDHTPYYNGPVAGYIAWLPGMMANWRATMHTALSALFVVDGDVAQGQITARAWHLTLDGMRQFVAWGRYADHYEKRDGIWRFARRSFILDHAEDLPSGKGDDFGSEGVGTGRAGADDPVHARLSLFSRMD